VYISGAESCCLVSIAKSDIGLSSEDLQAGHRFGFLTVVSDMWVYPHRAHLQPCIRYFGIFKVKKKVLERSIGFEHFGC
jgi:hypothetical protein